jgi:hypothetical protein
MVVVDFKCFDELAIFVSLSGVNRVFLWFQIMLVRIVFLMVIEVDFLIFDFTFICFS